MSDRQNYRAERKRRAQLQTQLSLASCCEWMRRNGARGSAWVGEESGLVFLCLWLDGVDEDEVIYFCPGCGEPLECLGIEELGQACRERSREGE